MSDVQSHTQSYTTDGTRAPVDATTPQRTARARLRPSSALLIGLGVIAAAALAGRATRRVERRRRAGELVGGLMGELGRGFLAGMAGTLAITTASATQQLVIEANRARKEGRPVPIGALGDAIVKPWQFSAGVASKVLGFTFDPARERRLSVMAHWEYGSTWGLSLPLFHALGLRGVRAMGAVLAGQLGAEFFVMPAFGLFAGPAEWGRSALVSSAYQHAIYAVAAVSAFEWLAPKACE